MYMIVTIENGCVFLSIYITRELKIFHGKNNTFFTEFSHFLIEKGLLGIEPEIGENRFSGESYRKVKSFFLSNI